MNIHAKDLTFFEFGHEAYCFLDGPDPDFPDFGGIPVEYYERVQGWLTPTPDRPNLERITNELTNCVRDVPAAGELLNPLPGGENMRSGFIEVRCIRDSEVVLVWRDVAINWYKRPGRCTCFSRDLTTEEVDQFIEELGQALYMEGAFN